MSRRPRQMLRMATHSFHILKNVQMQFPLMCPTPPNKALKMDPVVFAWENNQTFTSDEIAFSYTPVSIIKMLTTTCQRNSRYPHLTF